MVIRPSYFGACRDSGVQEADRPRRNAVGPAQLTRLAGPAKMRRHMSSEALPPTLDEAVRCPLLEGRQEEWIKCCTARFLPLARRLAGNDRTAEDLLHDTWIIAIDKVHQYRGQPPACGWIQTIVRREAQHAAVRRGREPLIEDQRDGGKAAEARLAAHERSPEDAARERQMVRLLLEVVDSLPPIYREVVRLRDLEERSEQESAVRLHLSASGVASRLQRAHRLIRDRLGRRIGQPQE